MFNMHAGINQRPNFIDKFHIVIFQSISVDSEWLRIEKNHCNYLNS